MEVRLTKRVSLAAEVKRHIQTGGPGIVVGPTDFLALGSRAAVDQVLSRLTKEGTLQRLRRGVYYYPQVNERIGITLFPASDAVASALARGRKSTLQVSGAQAANLLGLSEQVPARVVYLTDGSAGKIRVENQTIELRHASPRSMQTAGRVSGTVIQALRHLGKKNVTPDVIRRLRANLSQKDKTILRQDLLFAPGWMRPILTSVVNDALMENNRWTA